MAWVKFENFSDDAAWQKRADSDLWYDLNYTDWPEYMASADKDQQIRLDFSDSDYSFSYVSRAYDQPLYFRYQDQFGKFFDYTDLIFIYQFEKGIDSDPLVYNKPDDFMFSLSILSEGELIREWFLPAITSGCGYERLLLDVRPLIEDGYDRFDEVRVNILKHPGDGARLYLGDMYIFQDNVIHNVSVGIARLLHHYPRKFLTVLKDFADVGAKEVILESGVDVHAGTPIMIGNPDEGIWEYHIVDDGPAEDTGYGAKVKFTGLFDGHELLYAWPQGTKIYFAPPALYGDVRELEGPFPSYYIAVDAPEAEEKMTRMLPEQKICYVRDPDEENHTVAFALARDTMRVPVEIYVYANTPEEAEIMWQNLRRVFNSQNQIDMAGICVDYEIITTRNPVLESYDEFPRYIMELLVYAEEDVHDRTYLKFPLIKRLTIGTGSDTSVDDLLPVEADIKFGG